MNKNSNQTKESILSKDGVSYLIPFILVTSCFALWGFANDITNPMVKAFSKIFRMSVTDGALVQVAFYGGYFAMAFPAAMFIRRFTYKAGVLLGLGLYALGAFLFFPAKLTGDYYPFLIAYFIMTCGLSFLETSCNPYILSMGTERTATRRLNLAQAFNPMGSLLGMFVAMNFIQNRLNPMDTVERSQLTQTEFEQVRDSDLAILIAPYLVIGVIILIMLLVIRAVRMPHNGDQSHSIDFLPTLKRIFSIRHYREGVVAQFFYVGAQIMCWTFIIQYGTHLFMSQGMEEQAAEVLSQKYNIVAMVIFCISRFICTFMLKYLNPGTLLKVLALVACVLTLGVMFLHNIFWLVLPGGRIGLYVTDVPHYLRYSPERLGRRCQVWCRRTDYGHSGRFGTAAGTGCHHRLQGADGYACCQPVVCAAAGVLCGDCDLRPPRKAHPLEGRVRAGHGLFLKSKGKIRSLSGKNATFAD